MGFSYRLTHSMTQALDARQKALQLCLEQINTVLQKIKVSAGADRVTSGSAVFGAMLVIAQSKIRDQSVFQELHKRFSDKDNQKYLLSLSPLILVKAVQSGFTSFAAEALVDGLNTDSEGRIVNPFQLNSDAVSRANLLAALTDTSDFKNKILGDQEIVNADPNIKGSIVANLTERRVALSLAEQIQPEVNILANIMKIAFAIADADQPPILRSFFKEAVIMDRFELIISERLRSRFYTRFKSINNKASEKAYKDAMINTIGEFALVGLGVIGPELFVTRKNRLDAVTVAFTDQNMNDTSRGVTDLSQLLRSQDLSTGGTFYWSRWAVPGVRLNQNSDKSIRKLLREIIAADCEEIFAAFNFSKFIEGLNEIKREASKVDWHKHYADRLCALLESENLQRVLMQKAANSWYPALHGFFVRQAMTKE